MLTEKEKIKEKEEEEGNTLTKKEKIKEKKKKKANTLEVKFNVRGIFGSSFHELFGGPREKTPGSHHLFSFLSTQPKTYSKKFFFLFSLQSFLSTLFHL